MSDDQLIDATKKFVRNSLEGAEGGHDWFHTERVYKNALLIAKSEPCDIFVVALGALLHDIADSKFHNGDELVGPKMAREFLSDLKVEESIVDHVVKIVENISFKGGNFTSGFSSPELSIVQDADRLDAIGAIGIARAFNYGGFKNRKLYDPDIAANQAMSKEEYKKSESPTINHFYEKLLKLKDLMNTVSGRELALRRHDYMKGFLDQFLDEWAGEK